MPSRGSNGTGGDGGPEIAPARAGDYYAAGTDGGEISVLDGGEISVLSLFGFDPIAPVEGGSDEPGPWGSIQRKALEAICAASGGELCLSALAPGSEATGFGSASPAPRSAFNAFGGRIGGDRLEASSPQSSGAVQPGGGAATESSDSSSLFAATASPPCESATSDAEFTAFSPVRHVLCSPASLTGARAQGEEESESSHWLGDAKGLALVLIEVLAGLAVLLAPLLVERYFRPAF